MLLFQLRLILAILLALIGLHITSITTSPTIIEHHGALFQKHGYLIGGLSWAHITVDINLTTLTEDLNRYQTFIEYFDILSIPDPQNRGQYLNDERKRMRVLRQLCERKMNKMKNILQEIKADLEIPDAERKLSNRPKRQLAIGIAAIGGLIVGAVTGSLFSQFKTTALVDILEKRVQTITTQVEQNTIMVLQNSADIKRINQTLSTFETTIGKLILTDKIMDHHLSGIYTTFLLDEQLRRIEQLETALDQLLIGKIHKGLVSTEGLLNALTKIRKDALNHGLLIGVQRPLELYQLPASFLFNSSSQTIHAILHIPMYRENHILALHRYIPTPFKLTHLDAFAEVRPIHQYLARSPDGTLIKRLHNEDLSACLSIGHAYFCDDHSLEKPTPANCLLNLFNGLNTKDLGDCEVHLLPSTSTVERIGHDRYAISDSSPITILEACSGQTTTPYRLQPGTYLLTVNPNCTTSSDRWVIHPTLQLEDVIISSSLIPFNGNISDLLSDLDYPELETIHASLKSIGKPIPLSDMKQLIDFKRTISAEVAHYRMAHFFFSSSTATGLIITIIVIAIFFFCYCRHRRRQPQPQQAPPPGDQQQIPLLNFPLRTPDPVSAP